jgi:hypothetical protein
MSGRRLTIETKRQAQLCVDRQCLAVGYYGQHGLPLPLFTHLSNVIGRGPLRRQGIRASDNLTRERFRNSGERSGEDCRWIHIQQKGIPMKITTAVLASILAMSSSMALAQAGGAAGGAAAGGGTGGAAATGAAGSSGSASSSTATTGTNGGSSTTGMNNGSATGTSPTLSTPGGMPSSVPAPGSTIKR